MGRKKEFTGIWIPRDVWEDDRLGVLDKVVFAVIAGLARGEDGCYATNKALAEFCKCSERKVCASVSALASAGYIQVDGGNAKTRRMYLAETSQKMRGNLAKSATQPRKNCEETTQNLRGEDENLPILYNYNNIYNNIYNNKQEKPTVEEIRAYIDECGLAVDPVNFWRYYDAAEWLDKAGHPINWRQKLMKWKEPGADGKDTTEDGAGGSFDTDEFLAAALARAGYENTADGDCPWMK